MTVFHGNGNGSLSAISEHVRAASEESSFRTSVVIEHHWAPSWRLAILAPLINVTTYWLAQRSSNRMAEFGIFGGGWARLFGEHRAPVRLSALL